MQHVHDLVEEYEHTLVARWTTTALEHGALAVDEIAHDRLVSFLRVLHAALATAVSTSIPSLPGGHEPEPDEQTKGVSVLDPRVAARAFAAVHECVLELARDRGVPLSPAEQLTLASHIHSAITRAVDLGSRQHERDIGKTAHDLRNPLGSAMMALTMLRSRVDFGKDARLGDTVERNLKRLQGLIDESTARHGKPAVASEAVASDAASSG